MQSNATRVSRQPTWFNWLAPSFLDLWFVGILFLLAAGGLAPKLLGDAGIGWHIRTGEQILRNHQIPRVDPFSASKNGQAWYAWEWLYDAGIALVHESAGLNGVVFFTAIVIAATYSIALRAALSLGADLVTSIFLLGISLSASSIHFLTRPHVLSWLFSVIWFAILNHAATDSDIAARGRLFLLPPIMLLWANLHGGFLTGFILLAIYLLDAIVTQLRRPTKEQRKWLVQIAKVLGLSFLASLVNPYGWSLYTHIYRYLSDSFLMNHIDEFQSPNFHGIAQQCFGLLLLIVVIALAANKKKLCPAQWLVVLFAVYSGLYSSRNLPVSSLLLVLIVSPILTREIKEASERQQVARNIRRFLGWFGDFSSRITSLEGQFRGHAWMVIALVLGLWTCPHGGRIATRQVIDAKFSETRFPVQAVNHIEQAGIHESIFAPDYWGGYLIYRLYPATRAFVDDRHDFYGSDFFRQYLTTTHVEPGWNDFLDQLHANWVLVPKDSPLSNILKLSSAWDMTYEDQTASLFHRK